MMEKGASRAPLNFEPMANHSLMMGRPEEFNRTLLKANHIFSKKP
jgi:hypothetical protein